MAGVTISEVFVFAPFKPILFGLMVVLPALVFGYARSASAVRKARPEFSLSRLEKMELDRAVLLYQKVSVCIASMLDDSKELAWRARRRLRKMAYQRYGQELADMLSYAQDLRVTIFRLRARPVERYLSWAHAVSAEFCWSRSLACHCTILASTVLYLLMEYSLVAQWLTYGTFLPFRIVDARIVYLSWIVAITAIALAPGFYFLRRSMLARHHANQFRDLKAFAAAAPDVLVHQPAINGEPDADTWATRNKTEDELPWFIVLGVSPSASIDEVKQAYKSLVKKNHPDRVHDMSFAFKDLAESETKRLNAAYEEALALQ